MTVKASRPLPAGSVLAHYRLEESIGEGAMGTVYRARDEGLDRTVAVKVLRPSVSGMTIRVDRFFREARAAARVSHPNLTHVYYVGGDGSYRFFAMEYVTGLTLDELLQRDGPADFETALDILVPAARGLAAAHAAGVVHRDVKPSNILIREDGTVKVTDFGLSKMLEGDVHSSQDGTVTGTPTYMAPEQCRSGEVDARTDIYALGLTAWTLLVGAPPFPGPSLGQVISDQIHTPLPSLRQRRPEVPKGLERAIERMCAKDPDKRPGSMAEVVELLEGCRPRAVHPASITALAVATIIDALLSSVAVAAVAWPLERYAGLAMSDKWDTCFTSLVFFAATCLFEVRRGITPGKWFLHLAVRSADGSEPPARAVLLREVVRFPGILLFATMLPIVLPFLNPVASWGTLAAAVAGIVSFYVTRGRTLSDVLTRTRVVYAMPPDERESNRRGQGTPIVG